ncbi:hypothetical protein D3C81_1537280 [compost metagenome]
MQRVEERPGQVGVAGGFTPSSGICELTTARGDGLADGHQRLGDVGCARIELQTTLADYVPGLHDQACLDLGVVAEGAQRREELAHQLGDSAAHTGGVDTDISHVVALGDLPNGLGLGIEVHPAELVFLQYEKLPSRYQWRGQHHQAGRVAGFRRVVAHPYRTFTVGPGSKRAVAWPVPAFHHAGLQHAQRENALPIVHELTHKQVLEGCSIVLKPQFIQVK